MTEFENKLKDLFSESFIDNFKGTGSQDALIERISKKKPIRTSYYVKERQHEINEFRLALDTLYSDQILALWDRVIRGRTTEHDSVQPPEVSDEMKSQLISLVRNELRIRRNQVLDSIQDWDKIIEKNADWADFANETIQNKVDDYNRLIYFLRLLQPAEPAKVEVASQVVEFTDMVKDKVMDKKPQADISEVEAAVKTMKQELKESNNGSFIDRLPNYLESKLVSAGLTAIWSLLKRIFGF